MSKHIKNAKSPLQKLSLSAALAAIGMILMTVGSAYGKADIVTAIVASVPVALAYEHTDRMYAVSVYAVIAVLSVLFVPQKTAPLLFVLFFGYFPLLKRATEQTCKSYLSAYLIKALALNAAVILLLVLAKSVVAISLWICVAAFAVSNIVLPFYDRMVGRIWQEYQARFSRPS